jgi:hypothetical protein
VRKNAFSAPFFAAVKKKQLIALAAVPPSTPSAAGPTCWLLFGYMFYSEPVLRLPLLLYHLYIISPAGRRAVAYSRVPWLLRRCPLYWGQASYFKGSDLVKTADLDPSKRYVFAGHPHGLLGNAYFLAFCTNQLGFEDKFPGIRLSIGEALLPTCCRAVVALLPLGHMAACGLL